MRHALRCGSTLTACLVGLSPALTFAQAAPPAQAPAPPAREGLVEFAYVGTTGNASTRTIGLSGEAIVRPDRWVVRNKAAFLAQGVQHHPVREQTRPRFKDTDADTAIALVAKF